MTHLVLLLLHLPALVVEIRARRLDEQSGEILAAPVAHQHDQQGETERENNAQLHELVSGHRRAPREPNRLPLGGPVRERHDPADDRHKHDRAREFRAEASAVAHLNVAAKFGGNAGPETLELTGDAAHKQFDLLVLGHLKGADGNVVVEDLPDLDNFDGIGIGHLINLLDHFLDAANCRCCGDVADQRRGAVAGVDHVHRVLDLLHCPIVGCLVSCGM